MKRIACFFLALICLFTLAGCQSKTYEQNLLSMAAEARESFDDAVEDANKQDFDLEIEINRISEDTYEVTLSDNTQQIQFYGDDEDSYLYETYEIGEKHIEIVHAAREKVISYINSSSILNDKENLIEQINSVEIKAADMVAIGIHRDGVIYINQAALEVYPSSTCEYAIAHEFIHAVAAFTNGGIDNEVYGHNKLNEAITDIICVQLYPEILSSDFVSVYADYYYYILVYLDCFKEEAIEAYFYGYDSIWERTERDDFDFFVEVFAKAPEDDYAYVCYTAIMNKWFEMSK